MCLICFDQFGEGFVTAMLGLDHPGHFIVHFSPEGFLLYFTK
jgi:hypothetical protein